MTDYIASDWIENTGTVPAGVGPLTRIEVQYRMGRIMTWRGRTVPNDRPENWAFGRYPAFDVIRFRFLDAPAKRDARIARGVDGQTGASK